MSAAYSKSHIDKAIQEIEDTLSFLKKEANVFQDTPIDNNQSSTLYKVDFDAVRQLIRRDYE